MKNLKKTTKSGKLWLDIQPAVFFISAILIVVFVGVAVLFHVKAKETFGDIQAAIANNAGWFYVAIMNIILVYIITLMFGRYGKIRLGGKDQKPEFSTLSWFAMLFSAGMGIGLLFYGVAEPMFHYVSPPPVGKAGTADAASRAMQVTFLHWGLHPWAVYALVSLSLAFFAFNKGMPLTIRTIFRPLLGDRVEGWAGHTIDILATVATLFGVATSLGLGVQQVNAGLSYLAKPWFGVDLPQNAFVQLILIAVITSIATYSVLRGLDGGIKFFSQFNIGVAIALLLFVIVLGPTLFIFNGLIENIGMYLQNLPSLATWNETYTATQWQDGWTVFYWGWWIAWSPFVGMFIARVSKGRTIREFLMGVLLVPTAVTFLWLTAFGDSALNVEMFGSGGLAKAVQDNIPISLFVFLENYPIATITSALAVIVVITFFVTSSDSGSLVIDIITAGGSEDPPKPQRLFWAVLEGVVAAALLLGGGLVALQTAAITTGLPFGIVLFVMIFALRKGLREYLANNEDQIED